MICGTDQTERILLRIPRVQAYEIIQRPSLQGCVIDVETSGLDTAMDCAIEICVLPFTFDHAGNVGVVGEPYVGLEDPQRPLSDEVQRVTGLSDFDLAGKNFSDPLVEQLTACDYRFAGQYTTCDLIIAHNAAFDRKFVERRYPHTANVDWACSLTQVPWQDLGFRCTKLACLAAHAGWHFPPHRAEEDCRALLHLLHTVRKDGVSALKMLLDRSSQRGARLVALGAPFAVKDTLKARGYTWNDGTDGRHKAWSIDVEGGTQAIQDEMTVAGAWRARFLELERGGMIDPLTALSILGLGMACGGMVLAVFTLVLGVRYVWRSR